jgi:hypothetical protein
MKCGESENFSNKTPTHAHTGSLAREKNSRWNGLQAHVHSGKGTKRKSKLSKKKKNSQSKCGTWLSRLDADIWPTTDAAAAAEDEASTSLDEIAELWLGRRSSAALEIGTGCCGAPPPLLLLLALFVVVDLLRSS